MVADSCYASFMLRTIPQGLGLGLAMAGEAASWRTGALDPAAVKELKLRYQNSDTILFIRYIHIIMVQNHTCEQISDVFGQTTQMLRLWTSVNMGNPGNGLWLRDHFGKATLAWNQNSLWQATASGTAFGILGLRPLGGVPFISYPLVWSPLGWSVEPL